MRVSGPRAAEILRALVGSLPAARHATLAQFRAASGEPIDRGIVLYFPAPHSYTGEEVAELQAHGGPIVMQQLLRRCLEAGARTAQPGEFTRRAFLNDRIDLAQAESVADLIDAASVEAARSAARSLEGEFSVQVQALANELLELRAHVEACIDFPEEEIDPADAAQRSAKQRSIRAHTDQLLHKAEQGAVLREGLTVVLAGRPNVGKSSLLNCLAGEDVAIVTPVAGTTRDYVRSTIVLEGVPIHLVDTAGLRETEDPVERVGIERTWKALERGSAAVMIESIDDPHPEDAALLERFPAHLPRARVLNKIDLATASIEAVPRGGEQVFPLSAKTGEGVEGLRRWLLEAAGWKPHGEGIFMARQRHLEALEQARDHVGQAEGLAGVLELQAEELRAAHGALARITGEVTADDLLGEIFGRFCIGK